MSKGDTPNHSREPKCLSCSNATIIKGFAESQVRMHCGHYGRIPFPVYECSAYKHKLDMSLFDMGGMATILEPKKDGIGFTSRKLSREEQHALEWGAY